MNQPSLRENPWLTGMTLRDVFAATTLNALIGSGEWSWTGDQTAQAANCWATADLLIATRETAGKES